MTDDDQEEEDFGPSEPPPISARVLDLFRRAKEAKTKQDRTRAMLALSLAFTEEHDFTDFSATDDWHGYVEEFERSRLAYERDALRLARLVCNTLEEFYQGDEPIPAGDLDLNREVPAGTTKH